MVNKPNSGDPLRRISTLRIVSKRDGEEPYVAEIPIKGSTFSLVIPNGYINWPEGKPYPDSIRVTIDETRSMWVNFGVSRDHGFYTSLRIGEPRE